MFTGNRDLPDTVLSAVAIPLGHLDINKLLAVKKGGEGSTDVIRNM